MKKKILALTLASSLLISCGQEYKRKSLEKYLLKVQETIQESPSQYEDVIDRILVDAYRLKLEAIKNLKEKQGYAHPKHVYPTINKENNQVYLTLYNTKTQERVDLKDIEDTIQLGDFSYRFNGLKKEGKQIIYEKTKSLGRRIDQISKKWEEFFFLNNIF